MSPELTSDRPATNPGQAPRSGLLAEVLGVLLILPVRVYQVTLSPVLFALFGRVCRFEPSCSEYFIQSVRLHGPWRGGIRGVWRILRCNPFCAGGYDPP